MLPAGYATSLYATAELSINEKSFDKYGTDPVASCLNGEIVGN
jgi:hypothetical protein